MSSIRFLWLALGIICGSVLAQAKVPLRGISLVNDEVYVESPTDTDQNGKADLIYVRITRPTSSGKVPTIMTASPYADGGNNVKFHDVDVNLLPQDRPVSLRNFSIQNLLPTELGEKSAVSYDYEVNRDNVPFAKISAHSVGTGKSMGCPTVGDMSETLAIKAVIDWLNGSAKAYTATGVEVKADWSNGNVGMVGVSYNGTLPTMVATTGVKGLKAIVPMAAISSWYDYYRANGLVVGPGGYIGEDADVLAAFIVRNSGCSGTVSQMNRNMGRDHGDFTQFWKDRDYVSKAKNITAATFLVHGQSDWNVKTSHPIKLWNALADSTAPKKMLLHRGGHSGGGGSDVDAWLDHYVGGVENGIENQPQISVDHGSGLVGQREWPHESTRKNVFYFGPGNVLEQTFKFHKRNIIDNGISNTLEKLLENPLVESQNRLIFMTTTLTSARLLSGTPKVDLKVALKNRRAANISVAIIEYSTAGTTTVVTRGWADPQNHRDIERGELLVPGQFYNVSFELIPRQYQFSRGSRLGVVIYSTDFDYTLRPIEGTELEFALGSESNIELWLN